MSAPGGPGPAPSGPPLPGWLGPLVAIVTQVGVPTVVAGVLLYFVLFRIDTSMKYIQAQEDARTQLVMQMQKQLVETLDQQTDRFEAAIEKNIAAIEKNVAINQEQTTRLERVLEKKGP
jgi:hypothetical protein